MKKPNVMENPETLTDINIKLQIENKDLIEANKKLSEERDALKSSLDQANRERELYRIIQEQLLISEEKFRHLAEAMPQIVWTANPDGGSDYLNKKAFEFVGIKPGEDIRGAIGDAIHPDDVENAKALWQKSIKSGELYEVNYRLRRYDGEYHWFLVRGVPQKDEAGKVLKWYGTLTDINDQKLLEVKLQTILKDFKQAQIRYINAERLAKLGSWMHNLDNDQMIFSNEFYNIYEIDRSIKDFYYYQILKMVHPDDVDRLRQSIAESIIEKKTFDIQYRLVMQDGRIKTIHTISEPELNEEGKVIKRYGATMDITERKVQEEKLKKTLEELERSNEELEHYAYIASHDLQEPLRIISNFSNLLALRYKGRLDERADEFLNFIVESAGRMRLLITDLLSYARIPVDKRTFVKVDMNEIIEQVCRDLQVSISETGTEINCDPLPEMITDPVQMKQLFQNLITNAIKFRGDADPYIHISCSIEKDTITFRVKDNGIGFDPEYSPKVFELFHRLHDRNRYAGTGIGLALCKKIVEQHGGIIGVESEPGKGSTFYFTLPFSG